MEDNAGDDDDDANVAATVALLADTMILVGSTI
jgi:hypothetical protein